MLTPRYRVIAALLDAARADFPRRNAYWRELDRLELTDEEIAEVTRRLDIDDIDETRTKEWKGWSTCVLLTRRLSDSTEDRARAGRSPVAQLRLVRSSVESDDDSAHGRHRT